MKRKVRQTLKNCCCALLMAAITLTGIYIPVGTTTERVAEAASSVVENAISWAIATANDNSHGYSMSSRWGPDYDCSSFVISAFKNAGVNVGAATCTNNMRSQFTQHGFQWIPWSQIGGTSGLQRGDILLNEKQHTEIYLGSGQNVGAHSNRGYPQTGDQTGTEVSVSGYYYHPWNGVLRYAGNDICNCTESYAADYYVSTDSLPLTMRSGHGTGYSVVTSIPKGSRVYVSRANGSWAHVEWNGYSGYCSMQYLTKIESKSYNLHVWVSDSKMGNIPSNFKKGTMYYLCYELTDLSTGRRVNETASMNYKATETVRNSNGTVYEYTYNNSDNNWIGVTCDSEDTYTGTVTISGDVGVSCSVSFDVYADTAPQIKVWAWENDDSQEISSIGVGQTAYCSYLIRDKYTEKNLNDVTSLWTSGKGYTVTIYVYNPSGVMVKSQSYKNNDCTWISFLPDKAGDYKIVVKVQGNMEGTREQIIKAQEKAHVYGSWTITKKATCTENGIRTRTCTICSQKQTESIAKIEHSYDNGRIQQQATCQKSGKKVYTCQVCGATKEEQIPVKEHTLISDAAKKPTCTEDGLTEGSHCSECGEIIVKQQVIPACGHNFDSRSWESDETGHWNRCACGEKSEISPHMFEWKTDLNDAGETMGAGHKECIICGYCSDGNMEIGDGWDGSTGDWHEPTETPAELTGDYAESEEKSPEPTDDCVEPTEKPSTSAGDYTEPTEKPSASAGDYAEPTEKPSASAGDHAEPTEKPSASAGNHAEQTKKPSQSDDRLGSDEDFSGTEERFSGTEDTTKNSYAKNKVKIAKVKRVMYQCKKGGCVALRWKKVAKAGGYQIQYSLKKNFAKKKTKYTKSNRKVIKGLKRNKTYYIRIRAYSNTKTKQYGGWSKYQISVI